ncbi:MAG: MFS transporter [Acidimicrobiales bacterium]
MRHEPTLDHGSIAVLGVLTICTYGSWYYAFGVLFDPIREDTGWNESSLAASFSAGTILIGLGSLFGGRMLDRLGMRTVFLTAAVIGGMAYLVGSFAENVMVFTVAVAIGMGAFGSLGFYHVTMTVAVRANPQQPGRAIAVLTLWGALASAIFLPLTAQLVERFDWRVTMRILTAAPVIMFVIAILVVVELEPGTTERPSALRDVIRAILTDPASRSFTAAVAFGGIALATLLVYQVPVMSAAGLPLATAATVAAVRGVFQLSGRLPIAAIVSRLGTSSSLIVAFGAMAVGSAVLAVAGSVPVAAIFAVTAGFGIGAFSPLQGMRSEELYDRAMLGAAMGFQGTVLMLAGAIGPVVSGVIAEQTGERRWAAVIAAVASVLAAIFITRAAAATTTR